MPIIQKRMTNQAMGTPLNSLNRGPMAPNNYGFSQPLTGAISKGGAIRPATAVGGGGVIRPNTISKSQPSNVINRVTPVSNMSYGGIKPTITKLGNSTSYTTSAGKINMPVRSPGDKLTREYQKAQDAAVLANETRYADINAGYGNLESSVTGNLQNRLNTSMGMLEGAGEQERKDISASWANREGQGVQELIDAGMYNSTIKPSMRMGYQSQENADLGRLNDRLINQRVSTYGQMSGDVVNAERGIGSEALQFKANREDTYPDMNQYANLMQQYGMTGANSTGDIASTTTGNLPNAASYGAVITPPMISVNMKSKPQGFMGSGATYRPGGSGFTGGSSKLRTPSPLNLNRTVPVSKPNTSKSKPKPKLKDSSSKQKNPYSMQTSQWRTS